MIRIISVSVFLFWRFWDADNRINALSIVSDKLYDPLILIKGILYPLNIVDPLPPYVLELLLVIIFISGITSIIGLLTNFSLGIFTLSTGFFTAYSYSFSELHHPEAIMIMALGLLTLTACGSKLSIDSFIRSKFNMSLSFKHRCSQWPIITIQILFALIYLSAVLSKLSIGGLEWLNGYTLQYYLAVDGLRWKSDFAVWLSQFHYVVLSLQLFVVVFQLTFGLCVIFPRLKYLYAFIGFSFHLGTFLALRADFVESMALYSIFIPWAHLYNKLANVIKPAFHTV